MVITLDTSDSRTCKAIEIAAEAGQWARCKTANGQKLYGIPSAKNSLHLYLVTAATCTCEDFKRRQLPCKHVMAVRLHCALAKASATPKLTPTREDADVVSWDRAARVRAYDRIFGEAA